MTTILTNAKQLDSLQWHQLPVDGGQIVSVTYAVDEDHLYCRTYDQSDCSVRIERAELIDGEFKPQNGVLPECGEYEAVVKAPSPESIPLILSLAAELDSRGDRFAGNSVWDIAADWAEHFDDATEAAEWMEIGFWDAATAAAVRDLGLTAEQAADKAEALEDACEDASAEYTDGSVIYSVCNNDTPVSVFAD